MKATRYKKAWHHIHYGNLLLLASFRNMIATHKLLTAFILSFALNLCLSTALLYARGERDHYNKTAYEYEQKVDSLKILTEK